jgi:putative ABC transport system ATP-binding protein
MSTIVGKDLTKQYGYDDSTVYAIKEVNFRINTGEFVSIMGESGAGKSTILSIMGAMNAPSSGKLVVDDIDIYDLGKEQRADFRREFLGFIFQSFHLIPYLTVLENVMLPLTTVKISRKEKSRMAGDALKWVGLEDKRGRLPSQISGGEKERVAIARAIVNDPPILLADEPTGNLDTKTSGEIMALLKRLNTEGTTVIMVTHSVECSSAAQRVLHVTDGQVYEPN